MSDFILVFFATGFEEVEALSTVDVLRRGGLNVKTVSTTGAREVTGGHGVTILTDMLIQDIPLDAPLPRMIVLPGGLTALNEHQRLLDLIRRQHAAGRDIAAICASPRVLGAAGIGDGRLKATCYPGFVKQTSGFVTTGRDVEICDNIITGRGPALSLAFAFTLLRHLVGDDKAREVADGFLYEL